MFNIHVCYATKETKEKIRMLCNKSALTTTC